MQTESAPGAQRERCAGIPTGFRRLTPGLLQATRAAGGFDGMPEGVTAPGQVLAAFKAAAPRLGLAPRLVHAVDWLFKFTQPQDWGGGHRPIVWPSARVQGEALGLSRTQVKATNRALGAAGLITMEDSPNGKRYGARDGQKHIVEAYGFDLSPLAARYAEFVRLAAEANAERAEMGRLRRRAKIARNGITQILETVAAHGLGGDEWANLPREARSLTAALRQVERIEEMAFGVERLERRRRSARERLEILLAPVGPASSEAMDSDPKGAGNRPHQHSYELGLDHIQNRVMAPEGRKSDWGGDRAGIEGAGGAPEPGKRAGEGAAAHAPTPAARTGSGTVTGVSPAELVALAPRLRAYLKTPRPAWPDIVEAADSLCAELEVLKPLWRKAGGAMGWERAAIALALVSAKPPRQIRSSPGAYFHGMVAKAEAGELHLGRTIWRLRNGAGSRS